MDKQELKDLTGVRDALSIIVNSEIKKLRITVSMCNPETSKVELVLPQVPMGGPLVFAAATPDKTLTYYPAKPGEYLPNSTLVGAEIRKGNPRAYCDILDVVKAEFERVGYKLVPRK